MNLIFGPFLKYIAGGLLLALIVVGVALRVQSGRLAERTRERDAATAQVSQLRQAATGKDQTIAALRTAAEAWRSLTTPAESMNAAAGRAEQAARDLAARAAELRTEEAKDREDPDCRAVLALDLARACPAISAGLRQRAAAPGHD